MTNHSTEAQVGKDIPTPSMDINMADPSDQENEPAQDEDIPVKLVILIQGHPEDDIYIPEHAGIIKNCIASFHGHAKYHTIDSWEFVRVTKKILADRYEHLVGSKEILIWCMENQLTIFPRELYHLLWYRPPASTTGSSFSQCPPNQR
jgi:hypothetical protein